MNHPIPLPSHDDLDLRIEATCDTCDNSESFQVNEAKYTAWLGRRMPIQDALAHLSDPEREFVKSRTCPDCWTKMFGPNPFTR
ncbi:hypothetical protein [Nocardia miyunensis]|uniref:hypothetical protein n=1 Tax=Nocardia miyunensis TaxID=282684 RepID=UPI0008302089|nr:hypothetical protein [Nocardia miyunensis]